MQGYKECRFCGDVVKESSGTYTDDRRFTCTRCSAWMAVHGLPEEMTSADTIIFDDGFTPASLLA